ncbi:MAG TPA: dihydrodipicolinate reductase C-terminal domain-containing protein [Candidatus Baltobacteraceae bacterium]|nr:dihydrodipicolinate reductase C-terminal domain-containing protein [Candidatus Baltobacteraceae bacterium]
MLRVAVSGALGRMGRLACETVKSAPDLQYAGGFARTRVPEEQIDDDLGRLLLEQRPEVLIDFTTRPATQDSARTALENGVFPVIGSSEWNEQEREELGALCDALNMGALLVPNFAIGAVLMMRFAQEAARFFPTIEIVEMHRADKRDKPSGTAAATAARIKRSGGPADVPIHSVRLQGLLAHQEVLCGSAGELLTIRHDSLSRESFAAGILFAIRNTAGLKGLHVGLDAIIRGAGGERP